MLLWPRPAITKENLGRKKTKPKSQVVCVPEKFVKFFVLACLLSHSNPFGNYCRSQIVVLAKHNLSSFALLPIPFCGFSHWPRKTLRSHWWPFTWQVHAWQGPRPHHALYPTIKIPFQKWSASQVLYWICLVQKYQYSKVLYSTTKRRRFEHNRVLSNCSLE